MHHQRSLRCLGAAPLAAALLSAPPAGAVLGGVTPAPDMLQVFAEGVTAAGQHSTAARLAPPAAALGSRGQRASRRPRWQRR